MKIKSLVLCFKYSFVSSVILFLAIQKTVANNTEDIEYGEYLSSQCVTCHQLSNQENGIPTIVGWDIDSFYAVMASYKKKERENKVMQTIAASLSDKEIKALALYFSQINNKNQ